MIISKLFLKFILYSIMGWIWESIFCTLKEGEWQDRGFLFGPVCPIYGVGAITVSLLFTYIPVLNYGYIPVWQIFLICAVGSAVLEYMTSFVLEKIFHAKWWDYSDVFLNINGRICLPASLGFGVAGVVIVRYLFPVIDGAWLNIPGILAELLALFFMAVFAADLALTLASLTQLLTQLSHYEEEFNQIMATKYQIVGEKQGQLVGKVTEYASHLSLTQRHALGKIKNFSLPSRNEAAARIKESLLKLPKFRR